MEESCRESAEMLVDYADGQLPPSESAKVAAHLARCKDCRAAVQALQKSLNLAKVIWEDGLAEIDTVRVPTTRRLSRFRWRRYAAVAASILMVIGISALWRAMTGPEEIKPKFAEIEQSIQQAGNAARLLATAELLARYPDTRPIMQRQYRYIVNTYPQTPAAATVKLRIQ
ncbi:MAG: anti-sigma factor family protein [Planctomycetota bacterium]|jgi:anti-sigma factor RsiW